ncbi:MAG: hypothetical protein VYC40_01575 [Pseudomonadota bacterium]|nr:hypothetical protein [Pseudomonadota bacterium]
MNIYSILWTIGSAILANGALANPAYTTSTNVCGEAGSLSLGCIALRLASGGEVMIQLLLAIAFVSGWGFVVAAIFKFKQVRENPTQVPVSTPFAFLLTAILLIFIPGLMQTSSQTVFGSDVSTTGQYYGKLYNTAETGLLNNTVDSEGQEVTIESDTEQNLFAMAYRVLQLFPALMSIIIGGSYIAGLGFAIVAMTKLKAIKESPQQNPPTIPLAYLAVAVFLVFMPEIIRPTTETMFGSEADVAEGGAAGQGSSALIRQ